MQQQIRRQQNFICNALNIPKYEYRFDQYNYTIVINSLYRFKKVDEIPSEFLLEYNSLDDYRIILSKTKDLDRYKAFMINRLVEKYFRAIYNPHQIYRRNPPLEQFLSLHSAEKYHFGNYELSDIMILANDIDYIKLWKDYLDNITINDIYDRIRYKIISEYRNYAHKNPYEGYNNRFVRILFNRNDELFKELGNYVRRFIPFIRKQMLTYDVNSKSQQSKKLLKQLKHELQRAKDNYYYDQKNILDKGYFLHTPSHIRAFYSDS